MSQCPYCNTDPVLRDSAFLYGGRSYGMVWWCPKCGAFVGCHRGTTTPLGTLANKELREIRKTVHLVFDHLWKNASFSRAGAYEWLSKAMGLPKEKTHIAMFDVDQCRKALRLLDARHRAEYNKKEPKGGT